MDVEYASGHYYFYEINSGIWKKGSDRQEPILYYQMEKSRNWLNGRSLRTGHEGKTLIINHNLSTLTILDLISSPPASTVLSKSFGTKIMDFTTYGQKSERICLITADGFIACYSCTLSITPIVRAIQKCSIRLIKSRSEIAFSVNICPRNQFIVAQTCNSKTWKVSRLKLLVLAENEIYEKASLDLEKVNLKYFRALEIFGYFGPLVVVSGLTREENSQLVTFCYNSEEGSFEEVKRLRKTRLKVDKPLKMVKVEDGLLTSDRAGNLTVIRYFF